MRCTRTSANARSITSASTTLAGCVRSIAAGRRCWRTCGTTRRSCRASTRGRCFRPQYLASLRLLPTEYVYFYVFPERAVANTRAAGRTRGMQITALTDVLFKKLAARPHDAIEIYEQYLAERSGSYMQAETGLQVPTPPSPWAELTGYDRIAYDVMAAIVNDTNAIVPLNVPNAGNIPELESDDVIEAPCVVGRKGPRALAVGSVPAQVRELVMQVKTYERKTIDAAATMKRRRAR